MIAALFVAMIAAEAPIPVRVVAPAGPVHVGQAIELKVEAGGARIEPPKVDGAEVRPIVGSGSAFRLIPRRPGPLTIPPFRARLGGRSGASRALSMEVREPPPSGRPSTFLGGVGPIRVESVVDRAEGRPGSPIALRIRLVGPGAAGSTRPPAPQFGAGNPLGFRSEPIGEESADEPPSKTFRFRLRASKPGDASLPPMKVSTFDPATLRYQTFASTGRKVRIVDVEEFDPGRVVLPPEEKPGGGLPGGFLPGIAAAATLSAILVLAIRRLRRPPSPDRRLALALARIDRSASPEVAAIAIQGALADDLARRSGRPSGALTPDEAAACYGGSTLDRGLAEEAARLVALCDRAVYAGDPIPAGALLDAAAGFQAMLARKRRERHP